MQAIAFNRGLAVHPRFRGIMGLKRGRRTFVPRLLFAHACLAVIRIAAIGLEIGYLNVAQDKFAVDEGVAGAEE